MTRQFEIKWPDFNVTLTIDLLDKENPQLCEELWQSLPFDTVFMAMMSSGELFRVPIPLTLSSALTEKLILLPDEPLGSITLSANGVYLLVKYGTVTEPIMVPRIAWIPGVELQKLRSLAIEKLCNACFFTKEINIAKFKRKE